MHPLETFIGLALFFLTTVAVGLVTGPFHVATFAVLYLIYTQQNIINHTYFDLDYFPFKTVNYLTTNENMHKGNYGSITPLYDYVFGTLD